MKNDVSSHHTQAAIRFVSKVANLKKRGEPDKEGKPLTDEMRLLEVSNKGNHIRNKFKNPKSGVYQVQKRNYSN